MSDHASGTVGAHGDARGEQPARPRGPRVALLRTQVPSSEVCAERRRKRRGRSLAPHRAVLVLALTLPGGAAADPGQLNADSFPVRAPGPLRVEGGLVTGFPPVLSTGLSMGVGAAATYRLGVVRLGGRAAWVSATESSLAWEVTQQDLQARALVGIEHRAGRGALGVRIGLGGSLVHERRLRAQGGRAGLDGDELEMTALALLPAADLEATVGVQIVGAWSAQLAGGPALLVVDGDARWSWVATVGTGWQP